MKRTIGLALCGTAAAFAFACAGASVNVNNSVANVNTNTAVVNKPTASPVDIAAGGKKLYEQNCAVCHKDDGTGGPVTIEGRKMKPDNLTTDHVKKMSDEKIMNVIVNGVVDEGMPAFKDKSPKPKLETSSPTCEATSKAADPNNLFAGRCNQFANNAPRN